MKRVKSRATAALLLAIFVLLGMLAYVYEYIRNADRWVMYRANDHVYYNGVLAHGTITDRDGLLLARSESGEQSYAADATTRIACLHAVGDFGGSIGTGALTAFADRLVRYNLITGVSVREEPLALCISAELQKSAYTALAGRRGCVLVMDYTNGEILCMVSTPAYDPATSIDPTDPAYDGVYLNRALSVTYTPGSVFKLVTLAAAIENIPNLSAQRFTCNGSVVVDGMSVRCTGVHGEQSIDEALANSCNCAFAELSLQLGGETLARYAQQFGLTESLSVNGIETAAGHFDAASAGSADLAWSGIGQSTDLVCPLAMLRLSGAIAAGGSVYAPTLLLDEPGSKQQLLSRSTATRIGDMMHYNVEHTYGASRFPGLNIAGKTGTAELGDGSSHSWFTGFLDDAQHPYAFVVVVERGGAGITAAGSVANTVLQKAVNIFN